MVNVCFKTILGCIFIFLCAACGIETSVSTESSDDDSSEAERAVFIARVQETGTGNIITCQVNEVLVAPNIEIEIFFEYDGTEIERASIKNKETYTFSEYNPAQNGTVVCVIEYASAEFESESTTIRKQ